MIKVKTKFIRKVICEVVVYVRNWVYYSERVEVGHGFPFLYVVFRQGYQDSTQRVVIGLYDSAGQRY